MSNTLDCTFICCKWMNLEIRRMTSSLTTSVNLECLSLWFINCAFVFSVSCRFRRKKQNWKMCYCTITIAWHSLPHPPPSGWLLDARIGRRMCLFKWNIEEAQRNPRKQKKMFFYSTWCTEWRNLTVNPWHMSEVNCSLDSEEILRQGFQKRTCVECMRGWKCDV